MMGARLTYIVPMARGFKLAALLITLVLLGGLANFYLAWPDFHTLLLTGIEPPQDTQQTCVCEIETYIEEIARLRQTLLREQLQTRLELQPNLLNLAGTVLELWPIARSMRLAISQR